MIDILSYSPSDSLLVCRDIPLNDAVFSGDDTDIESASCDCVLESDWLVKRRAMNDEFEQILDDRMEHLFKSDMGSDEATMGQLPLYDEVQFLFKC